jgi:hypothetical protein
MNKSVLYKPDTSFTTINGIISLREFEGNLVSLLGNSFNLSLGNGVKEPINNFPGNQLLENGPYTSYKKLSVSGPLVYHKNNFQLFKEGSIRFNVKTEKVGGFSEQSLININSLAEDNEYYALGISLKIGESVINQDIIIHLNRQSNFNEQLIDIENSIILALGEEDGINDYTNLISVSSNEADLVFRTTQPNYIIELKNPMSQEGQSYYNLLSLFESVSASKYVNIPEENITFFSLEGEEDYIRLIHKTDGMLWIKMHGVEEFPACYWNKNSYDWMEIELSFNEQIIFLFVDGKLSTIKPVSGILREHPETNLVLRGTADDTYSFGQVAFFSSIQHTKNYTPSLYPIKKYSTNAPYIEIHYGFVELGTGKSVEISSVGDIKFSLYNGSLLLVNSLPREAFIQAFANNATNAYSDLIIKAEFNSDGDTPASLVNLEVNPGEVVPNQDTTNPANFNIIFDFIRRSLGYPRVPVELTDEQLLDTLNLAVFQYNRYRNYRTKLDIVNTIDLEAHPDGSYYLPVGIDEDDIMEILFKPRYSWSWYSGDNSLMANMYMQNLFSGYNLAQSAADYYINISTQNDLKNIFGSQSGWNIANGRLYLYPKFPGMEAMRIGIKYRETISINEICSNMQIRQLALAYAKITLGNIRSTFGNQIPGGDAMLQLNGNDLIQQGQAERDMLIQEFIKQQPILQMIWT